MNPARGLQLPIRRLRPGTRAEAACQRLGIATVGDFLAIEPEVFCRGGGCGRATQAALQRRVDQYLEHAAGPDAVVDDPRPLTGLVRDPRALDAFLRLGLRTVADFLATPKAELLALRGFGVRTWQRVLDRITATRPMPPSWNPLLPRALRRLSLAAAALPPDLVRRLQDLGCTTIGDVFALPPSRFLQGNDPGPAAAGAIRSALDQLFRAGLEQTVLVDPHGVPAWSRLRADLLQILSAREHAVFVGRAGIDGPVQSTRQLARDLGVERRRVRRLAIMVRARLQRRAATFLCRLRHEMTAELRAFEGVVTGEHYAPGTLAHAIARATGDPGLPLRLCGLLFPDAMHCRRGVLTGLPPRGLRRLLRRLRALTRPAALPVAVDELLARLADAGEEPPRGLVLHLLRRDLRRALRIDPELGEVVDRNPNSVAMRLRRLLLDEGEPRRTVDLLFLYRARHRSARTDRLLDRLHGDPLFVATGPGIWGLRELLAAELARAGSLAAELAAGLLQSGQRAHVADLLAGRTDDQRLMWLVQDRLRADPRLRYLGRGEFCPADRAHSAVLEELLADLHRAMGELPVERFLHNQPEARRRLLSRLLAGNRRFVSPAPGRIDLLTNYPFDRARLDRLLQLCDGMLTERGGHVAVGELLQRVQTTDLGGGWLTAHLLTDVVRRHGSFEVLPGGIIARPEIGLLSWLLQRTRLALRRAGMPMSAQELLLEQPELARFGACLEEVLGQDPMLHSADGTHWQLT